MNFGDIDAPLGEQFLSNPYQFLQSFVRNMNNQIFLSEYQLSHLFVLLLLRKQSPWDQIKPNSASLKMDIEGVVNKKISQVKVLLEGLSQVYEDKVKKNTFNQIQRLMNIIKAKNKSIYIQKDLEFLHQCHLQNKSQQKIIKQEIKQKINSQNSSLIQIQNQKSASTQKINTINNEISDQSNNQLQKDNSINNRKQIIEEEVSKQSNIQSYQNSCQQHQKQENKKQKDNENVIQLLNSKMGSDQRQVMTLFYGISNLPNLSSLALGNCLQYSGSQRYIKFKMSKNYIMTIKNEDQLCFDKSSTLRNVSSDLFTHHIFSYLTAVELFKVRSVCKQWMQNVKQAWHSTFKRQMFIQLMACQFCKQIQHYYKLIQLRNPFFQKISLLMHALVQLIQWDKVYESITNNTIIPQLKKVLIILLKLLGQNITITNLNSITQEVWQQNKDKIINIKTRIGQFLSNIDSSQLNIKQLIKIKIQLLDDPFMRVEQLNSQDKTPLLLVIFIKQLNMQQLLKNHIYFSQQYLMTTKKKLDDISSKMPQQKGFLEGVYKILLLRNLGGKNESKQQNQDEQRNQMPNFQDLLSSIFSSNPQSNKPDFVIKNKSNFTNIYMDKATKFDIIMSTVKKLSGITQLLSQPAQISVCTPEDEQQLQRIKNEKIQQKQEQKQRIKQNREEELEQKQQPGQSFPRKQLKTVNIYNINVNQQAQKKMQQQENQNQKFQNNNSYNKYNQKN